MSVNKVTLIGNVGKDPEIINTDNGTIAKFGLATSETYKNRQGEKVTDTEWHNIVIYRKLAEIVEKYVKKGQLLYIEGKIKTRSWDDKEGQKRYTTEIVLNDYDTLQMLGSKSDNAENTQANTPPPNDDPLF